MKRLTPATAGLLLMAAALAQPATASAAVNSADTNIAVDAGTQLQMNITANCVLAEARCYFNTRANLMTPGGMTGFPGDAWARQTITLRSTDRDVWQEAQYSAPSGTPPETKGANHDNVLSKMYMALNNVEISITYFGGGPVERFSADGSSAPRLWSSGLPATGTNFTACSNIRVVYGGVNLTTPTACAQTTFS
jgi:hypothetical protein